MLPVGLPVFILTAMLCPSASSGDSHLFCFPPLPSNLPCTPRIVLPLFDIPLVPCPWKLTHRLQDFLSDARKWYIIEWCKWLQCFVEPSLSAISMEAQGLKMYCSKDQTLRLMQNRMIQLLQDAWQSHYDIESDRRTIHFFVFQILTWHKQRLFSKVFPFF